MVIACIEITAGLSAGLLRIFFSKQGLHGFFPTNNKLCMLIPMSASKEAIGFFVAFVVAALVGVALCVDGVLVVVSGSRNVIWLTDHNVLIRNFIVTGASARLLGTAEIAFGISLVVAAALFPRAIDARRTRGSLLALPTWTRRLLVAATLILGVSTIIICSTFFWPASS